MKVIPAIDLIGGKTVRLEQGRYDRKLSYEISPLDAARRWESMGAELIHVVDLDGARAGFPVNLQLVKEIADAVKVPVEVGGGFRRESEIREALDSGIGRVIIGSRAFEDISFARRCFDSFPGRVILSVDARNFRPQIRGWEQDTDVDMFDVLREFVSFGVREIIYTDIQKDGTLAGPSTDQLKKILSKVDVKVVSAGGVKTVEHVLELKALEKLGLTGVIIGRALYEGTIDLKEAIDAGKADNPVS